jgi:hypothetical protein
MKAFVFGVAAGVVALAGVGAAPAALPKTTGNVSVPTAPRLFLADGRDLAREKKSYQAGDKQVVAKSGSLLGGAH